DRGVPDTAQAQTGIDALRIAELLVEGAEALDRQADDRTRRDVERAALDQVCVHDCVEIRVVNHVVDMAVDVVVAPAGRDLLEVAVARAGFGGFRRLIVHRLTPWRGPWSKRGARSSPRPYKARGSFR